jgi:hypothetical protein
MDITSLFYSPPHSHPLSFSRLHAVDEVRPSLLSRPRAELPSTLPGWVHPIAPAVQRRAAPRRALLVLPFMGRAPFHGSTDLGQEGSDLDLGGARFSSVGIKNSPIHGHHRLPWPGSGHGGLDPNAPWILFWSYFLGFESCWLLDVSVEIWSFMACIFCATMNILTLCSKILILVLIITWRHSRNHCKKLHLAYSSRSL